jgi:hypothetical protein
MAEWYQIMKIMKYWKLCEKCCSRHNLRYHPNFSWRDWIKCQKLPVSIACVPVKIRAGHLTNTRHLNFSYKQMQYDCLNYRAHKAHTVLLFAFIYILLLNMAINIGLQISCIISSLWQRRVDPSFPLPSIPLGFTLNSAASSALRA